MKIILQKYIAQSGLFSRRQAEELIRQGKVKVGGVVARIGDQIDAASAPTVLVNGKRLEAKEGKVYIKLNKPKGYVCTTRKFKGEKNVFDLLPEEYGKLNIVGRLDKDSRGLVLLTSDGELTYRLTHPKFGHEKKYEVSVDCAKLKIGEMIARFKSGIDIGEGDGIVKAKRMRPLVSGKFEIVLDEGKKRQIRRMFKALDYRVVDLLRTEIAGVKLGELKEGKWELLGEEAVRKIGN